MIEKKILLYILFLLSLMYISIFIIFDNNKYKEVNKRIIGKVVYIKKYSDKVTIDIKSNNKYRITLYKNIDYDLGDDIYVEGLFKTPKNNTIENTFNYRKYLLSKRIKMVSTNPKTKLINKNKNIFFKIKNKVIRHIDEYKSKDYIKTFILADNSSMEEDILKSYRSMGISHLLSFSGMHMSVFLLILNKILKNNKYKYIIIFTFMIFLLFITNYPASFLRCFIFLILRYINKQLKLKYNDIHVLIITFCILTLYNPYFIYNIGFMFSFIITFFILLSINLLKNKNYYYRLIIISLISFLSSIPILIYNFYNINLITPLFNILFVPIISIVIFPLGLITFLLPNLDDIYYVITSGMDLIINNLSNIDMFNIVISKPSIILIMIYYIILFLTIKYNKKIIIVYIILLLVNINLKYLIINPKVTYLDVGQGDSVLITYKKGKTIMIDTGGNKNYSLINNTITYLKSNGINKISYLVLTHGDFDHCGEAINLVNNFKVEKVIFNCGPYNDLEKELIKVLDKKKIKYYSCIKELNIDNDKLFFLQTKEYDNENDNSNVIYTELNGYKFMFMGDASITTEKEILNKYNLPDIDVLKVGHHGSKTSSGKDFINEIKPKYSIISVGKNNRYGHPNKEVLDNLNNSKIYRTDQDGSIMFKIKNNKLTIEACES